MNKRQYQYYVHVLVATVFIPNPDNKPEVNHVDGNKKNNSINNLEWVTKSENVLHAFKIGLKKSKIGKESHLCMTSEEKINDACKYMEEGLLTLKEISIVTGLSFGMIYLISQHKSWMNISSKYNIDNYYHDRESYSEPQYRMVFNMLHDNKLSLYEISDLSGVKYSSIQNIRSGVKNPIYDHLFNEIDISTYSLSGKSYKNIPDKLKDDANAMYKSGMKIKYIKRILSKRYNINEEKIRVFINNKIK